MSKEILDCLKRQRDICIKNILPSQNTAFMCTPALKKKKNKPRAEQEPRSAHGRAVKNKKNKQRVKHEPRSAHGRAVN